MPPSSLITKDDRRQISPLRSYDQEIYTLLYLRQVLMKLWSINLLNDTDNSLL